MADPASDLIQLGEVSGIFGIKGWLKVRSYTEPSEHILRYAFWNLHLNGQVHRQELLDGRPHGKNLVVKLAGCDNPEQASRWLRAGIWIARAELPELAEGEYYWTDLIGLQVETESGRKLGIISEVLATGANDVLRVQGERERLIPYIKDRVIKRIDLVQACVVVDWDADD